MTAGIPLRVAGQCEIRLMTTQWANWKRVGKWVFGALFVVAGANHFRSPGMYMKIMPPYLPFHWALVLLSGVFEIALGALLLVPQVSRLAAWGLVALLIAIFPANIYLYQHQEILPRSHRSSIYCDCHYKAS